eukprot:TRINITY_DN9470_c0_g1_i1.p2 TRINITY_DN9470_c0_g1~~TRINITY_DN9470_c0_g1_i1.p2  ORF type:complete len:111 (+),score=25.21 TRINITY_DN9470_c0_g1_i1:2-334(+)
MESFVVKIEQHIHTKIVYASWNRFVASIKDFTSLREFNDAHWECLQSAITANFVDSKVTPFVLLAFNQMLLFSRTLACNERVTTNVIHSLRRIADVFKKQTNFLNTLNIL